MVDLDRLGWFLFGILFLLGVIVPTVVGLVVALVGWGGARAGIVMGILAALAGAGFLALVLASSWPWLWWVAVLPLYFGWLAVATWRSRRGEVGRLPVRFGLRSWFVFLLAVCLFIGGAASMNHQHRAEQRVVAGFDPQLISVHSSTFGRVSHVIVTPDDQQQLAEALEQLQQLRALRSLQVNYSGPLAHDTFEKLAQLTSLDALLMQGVRPSDADLEPLGRLRNLRVLELDGRELSDAGLVHLYPLTRLERLYLYHQDPQKITRQGVQRLHTKLPTLEADKP